MTIIQLEIPDKLAEKLKPYQDRLAELLELGLQTWQEREQETTPQSDKERLWQVLAASGRVSLPKPYTGEEPYISRTPVPASGKPASEIVIEQRGPL